MRKLFFFCLSAYLFTMSAQVCSNRAYHHENGSANSLVAVDGNFYFFSTWSGFGSFSDPQALVSVNKTGAERFRLPSPSVGMPIAAHIIVTGNKELVAALCSDACDYPTNVKSVRLVRFDTTGKIIFSISFSNFPGNGDVYRGIKVAEMPGGDICVGIDNSIYRVDATGNMMSWKAIAAGGIRAITAISDTMLLVCADDSGYKSLLIDTSGTVHGSIPGTVNRYLRTSSGSILALNQNGTIDKLSPALTSKTVHTLAAGTTYAEISADTIYTITGAHGYNVYDTTFSLLRTYSLSVPLRSVAGLAVTQNDVGFISNGGSFSANINEKLQNGRHPAFTRFNKDTVFSYTHDIGVAAATCDSCVASSENYFRLRVWVKNFGTQPVNRFYLNCAQIRQWYCDIFYYHEEFKGVVIAPGDSAEVLTQGFVVKDLNRHVTYGNPGLVQYLKIFTTAPNLEVDRVPSNDGQPAYYVGVKDLPDITSLSVYPNPVYDYLNWETGTQIQSIMVSSVDGKPVLHIAVNAVNGRLDLYGLDCGIYFATFCSRSGDVVRKLIKQ